MRPGSFFHPWAASTAGGATQTRKWRGSAPSAPSEQNCRVGAFDDVGEGLAPPGCAEALLRRYLGVESPRPGGGKPLPYRKNNQASQG
jgi:hypothetical protein